MKKAQAPGIVSNDCFVGILL